jgi:hypothetical protein
VKLGYDQCASCGNREALEDPLRGRAGPLRDAGLEVDIDIRAAGEVARDILQAAPDHGAGLIVIGSRGQTMIRSLFLGSVARAVIRLRTLPVRLAWIEVTGDDADAACERTCHPSIAATSARHGLFGSSACCGNSGGRTRPARGRRRSGAGELAPIAPVTRLSQERPER